MSDRKYRQRGYQDEGGSGGGRGERRRPPQKKDGPRGRGLGKPTVTVFRCAVCGSRQTKTKVGFDATCNNCNADLRTCTHCMHFDSSAANECRQPVKERIASKAKRNRCELFAAKAAQEFTSDRRQPGATTGTAPSSSAAKAAFDALFKL